MFDHQQFSRSMKIGLSRYLSGESLALNDLNRQVEQLSVFDLSLLMNDDFKKAFWTNVYNGLTNYFIIRKGIKKSVWEVADFFFGLKVNIDKMEFSLDDIEHGILRKNGERKNGKPVQFQKDDIRLELMVKAFDPRIHFALNCGSVSCPPVAFYSAENIEEELRIAEESFADQEFLIDHTKKEIRCSEIFIWYRDDFKEQYLNAPDLSDYGILPRPYLWQL